MHVGGACAQLAALRRARASNESASSAGGLSIRSVGQAHGSGAANTLTRPTATAADSSAGGAHAPGDAGNGGTPHEPASPRAVATFPTGRSKSALGKHSGAYDATNVAGPVSLNDAMLLARVRRHGTKP